MAHLFLGRSRLFHLRKGVGEPAKHHRWETIKNNVYLFGGFMYVAGSILFFPFLGDHGNLGGWVFFFGSLLYFIVSAHDMAEVTRHRRLRRQLTLQASLEICAAASYLSGAMLFTGGRILFLVNDLVHPASHWCFIVGSLLFVLGACINILQIIESPSMFTLQLMNLTAVSFVAGSLLFTVSSVPYLWQIRQDMDRHVLYLFLAWQYLFGSMLFLVGGVFNYWRTFALHRGGSLN